MDGLSSNLLGHRWAMRSGQQTQVHLEKAIKTEVVID